MQNLYALYAEIFEGNFKKSLSFSLGLVKLVQEVRKAGRSSFARWNQDFQAVFGQWTTTSRAIQSFRCSPSAFTVDVSGDRYRWHGFSAQQSDHITDRPETKLLISAQ